MAEELSGLHIDTDWKKQAQEEKKRLAEQEQKRAAQQSARPATAAAAPGVPGAAGARTGARQAPVAGFASLVQSTMTQVLYYLGELAPQGMEPVVNLDMAKYHLDTLGILEEKTNNNLTPEEKHLIDVALYETRNRYISVASQYI
ncbi:MAG TPA: DUF1844 domain-containing protein [Tepidisphaeraceae bacterium]|jgi:hypothetical protein|nr:DUF1844 domain-containing protein [Tepidisphaeraceae bacterium]